MLHRDRSFLVASALAYAGAMFSVAAISPRVCCGQDNGVRPTQAIVGAPLGVLVTELPLPPTYAQGAAVQSEPRVIVEDPDGRVFYPVTTVRTIEVVDEPPPRAGIGRPGGLFDRVRNAIRGEGTKRQVPVAVTVAALFAGNEPFDLVLSGDIKQRIRIEPATAPDAATGTIATATLATPGGLHRKLLNQWWSEYTGAALKAVEQEDFPKLVHKYLTAMLAGRFDLPRVDLNAPPEEGQAKSSQTLETLALLAAIEPLREEIFDEVLRGDASGPFEELPVPNEPNWLPRALPALDEAVEIESMATRVPPECFYLRFGSFANYVWFQDIAERFGGDMAQAVLLRGFNYDASARMERMLASKLTSIAKMFGDQLIGDMALIGTDLYMKEGASLGALFYAKNPSLLTAAIESDRKAIVRSDPEASEQELMIRGRKVKLLSTPDNAIRSFLLVDGPYVFITSSRTLAERFLEVGESGQALSETPNFRWARRWMPEANDYSVFAYFSPDFFRRLVSPQYQIELRRRLEAIAHLEIAEVASQVALAEGSVANNIESLQSAGLLPAGFDQRVDGSQTLRTEKGWIDSLRGGRGSFLPIADVPIRSVSATEANAYASVSEFYVNEWQQMDPLLVGLRRFRVDNSLAENVVFEAYISPFDAEKYGWIARQLGQPTPIEMAQPADDAVSVQLHVRGSQILGTDDYHLFGGVKDMVPPTPEETKGLLKTLQVMRTVPAYVGAWPKPGLIEQLPLGLGRALAQPDYAGFSRMLGGLWRWQDGQFSLLSFDRSILDTAIPQLAALESTDLAQARAKIANLSGSQLAQWINSQWYDRGWRASRANSILLDAMHQQLKVPGDECLDVTQRLLDVRLQCPLGGDYVFRSQPGGGGWWESTAWPLAVFGADGKRLPPPGYAAPWIGWFRGARMHVTQQPNSLAAVGEIELEMPPLAVDLNPEQPTILPPMNFDLFSLPMKLFGGKSDADDEPKRKSF